MRKLIIISLLLFASCSHRALPTVEKEMQKIEAKEEAKRKLKVLMWVVVFALCVNFGVKEIQR